MKGNLIVTAVLALLTIPAICFAAPPRVGPYVSGFLGVNVLQNTDVSGSVGSTAINDRVEFDPGINVGGTGGFDFGYFRLEGELSYKHAEISAVNDNISGERFSSTRGSLGVFAAMANGFFDLHNDSPVTPYFGGGIGFATLHLNDSSGISNAGGGRQTLYFDDDDTVFAYQAGGGLEIALNRRLSLDLGYRYFATDTANFTNGQDLGLRYRSHSGTVGVRFKF
jgi:opacity protein-like surface antigen